MINVQSSKKYKESYVSILTVQEAKSCQEMKRKPIEKNNYACQQLTGNTYTYHKFIRHLKVEKTYI